MCNYTALPHWGLIIITPCGDTFTLVITLQSHFFSMSQPLALSFSHTYTTQTGTHTQCVHIHSNAGGYKALMYFQKIYLLFYSSKIPLRRKSYGNGNRGGEKSKKIGRKIRTTGVAKKEWIYIYIYAKGQNVLFVSSYQHETGKSMFLWSFENHESLFLQMDKILHKIS